MINNKSIVYQIVTAKKKKKKKKSNNKRCAVLFSCMVAELVYLMTGILEQLKWESSRKGGKTIELYCYIKVSKVKPVYQQMTLFPKLGVVEISTTMHFRPPLLIQTFINVASSSQIIRDWNVLPDSLMSSAEDADDFC